MNPGVRAPPPCPSGSCPSPPFPWKARTLEPGSLPSLCRLGRAPPEAGLRNLRGGPLSSAAPCGALRTQVYCFCCSAHLTPGGETGRRPVSGSWILGAPGRLTSVTPDRGSWIWNHVDLPSENWNLRSLGVGTPAGALLAPLRTPGRGFWVGGRGGGKNSGLWVLDLAARVISISHPNQTDQRG